MFPEHKVQYCTFFFHAISWWTLPSEDKILLSFDLKYDKQYKETTYYPIFWLHTQVGTHIQKEPPTLMLIMGETKRVILQGAAVTGGNPWTLQQDGRQSHNVKKGWLYEWPQSLLKPQWSECTNILCLNTKKCSHQLWIKLADLLSRHERCTS